MNKYYKKLLHIKNEIFSYLTEIFKVSGNELLLRLEKYNLLSNPKNCIETSTSFGFLIEEFVTSKLEIYTKKHSGEKIKINRISDSKTINYSYDCLTNYKDIFAMINIKVEKASSKNNGVAAINILHRDYVKKDPSKEKAYLVVKIHYDLGNSKRDSQRKILISGVDGYFLEEIDFSKEHKQDYRNWSQTFKKNSGRLQIPDSWMKKHLLPKEKISYRGTKEFINKIFSESVEMTLKAK